MTAPKVTVQELMDGAEIVKPIPPRVSEQYPEQRWFSNSTDYVGFNSVTVVRRDYEDAAFVSVSVHPYGALGLDLKPHELRALGRALISAAVDIDAYPARTITAPSNGG